jgi:hypothetical protein
MIFIMPISVLLFHILVLFHRHPHRETGVRCRDNSCLCDSSMWLCHQHLFRGHSPPVLVRRIHAITVTDSYFLGSTTVLAPGLGGAGLALGVSNGPLLLSLDLLS